MSRSKEVGSRIKHITPDNLYDQISLFTSGMAVTKGVFEILVERCTLQDMEWNHMDQQHRPSIHHTYDKGLRIVSGADFAVSLTQWGKWPLFITVSDAFVARGLFYQSLILAGVVFIHSVITMEECGNNIKLKDEWYIATHKLLRFLHKPLNKKLYKLNERLQQEDAQIRQGRFDLREKGYRFRSDQPDYLNSNTSTANTIYPPLSIEDAFFSVDDVKDKSVKKIGELEFLVKKSDPETYLVWPSACPHEGGPLVSGKLCESQIVCPWHGLRFSAVELSASVPSGARYGFTYTLKDNKIYVKQSVPVIQEQPECATMQC